MYFDSPIDLNLTEFDENLPSVLIVEDNVSLLNLMVTKLSGKYNLNIAINGNEAHIKLKSIQRLDLIISDVMMDNGNGFELYEFVSKQKNLNHIPFIFITAKSEDKKKGLELGAIDYILKPFSVDELIFKIDSILNNLSSQRKALIDSVYNSMLTKNNIAPLVTDIKIKNDKFEENCVKYNLTPQERKIIPLIAKGQTNKEIAETLFISDKTVKKHLQNIFEKVGVAGKIELLGELEHSVKIDRNEKTE